MEGAASLTDRLPPAFAADPDRRARFAREVKAVAVLLHGVAQAASAAAQGGIYTARPVAAADGSRYKHSFLRVVSNLYLVGGLG
jgi:hypothetical protein